MTGDQPNTEASRSTETVGFPSGPYVVIGPNGMLNQILVGRLVGPNDYVDPIGVAYGAGKQGEAIAALFAAAPDLLEALKAMDVALCNGFDTQEDRMAGRNALIAARAAVVKAEGR